MKIYRLYYIEQEYIPSDVYDEDGYCDDYYDNWIDHDITLGYFANKQAINKWIDEHENENEEIWNEDKYVCYDSELQIEEIEVIHSEYQHRYWTNNANATRTTNGYANM